MRAIARCVGGALVVCALVAAGGTQLFAEKRPALCIQGTMITEKPIAIINDQIVAVGDEISGATVVAIGDSSVDLRYAGETFSLALGDGCEGRTPAAPPAYTSYSPPTSGSSGSAAAKFPRVSQKHKALAGIASSMTFLYVILVLVAVVYVYTSYCLQLIAQKASCSENAWHAWVPILNLFLLAEIAQKAWWWALLVLVPYVNIVAVGVLWWGVAEARDKPGWVGLFMLVPGLNMVAMGYLAFSSDAQTLPQAPSAPATPPSQQEPPAPAPPPYNP